MRPLRSVPVGAPGFTTFAKGLERLGVLDHEELLGWLRLHGDILRLTGLPLDRGAGVPEELLDRLREEFGP